MAASLQNVRNVSYRMFASRLKLYYENYPRSLGPLTSSACTLRSKSTDTSENIVTPSSKVSDDVSKILEEQGSKSKSGHISYRNHPGIMRRNRSQLPVRLVKAIKILLEKYPVKSMSIETEKLIRYLQHRQIPISNNELTQKAHEIERNIIEKEGDIPEDTYGLELEQAIDKRKKKVESRLRQIVYHWKPMQYDAYTSFIYLLGCVATDYSIIMQCFTEISKRDPDFRPTSIYNFGSRIGSAIWAADKFWRTVGEYYCVDSSVHMHTIAQLLLQDGNEQTKVFSIKGVHFRQYEPSSNANKFSLVVSANMLIEQPNVSERLQLVRNLWNMAHTYLVLIENGTGTGFNLINEARDYLTELFSRAEDENLHGHIFAPCSHDKACPRAKKNMFCFSECIVNEPDFSSSFNQEKPKKLAKYSYLIVKKGSRAGDLNYPRVLQEKKAQRHTHLHLCLPCGELQHVIINKSKYERHVYSCARYVGCGDLLPVGLTNTAVTSSQELSQTEGTDFDAASDNDSADEEDKKEDGRILVK